MENNFFENSSISKSDPPAIVLEAFINELKSPLESIKGWMKILSMNPDKTVTDQALISILNVIEKVEYEEEKIKKYLNEIRTDS